MDICEGTWNERDHQSEHPRHDVQAYVTGRAARRLARWFARRWRRAGGERLRLFPSLPRRWRIASDLTLPARRVAICRTMGATLVPLQLPVREVRHLFTDAIAAAESLIYAENQYFASAAVYEALVARMREPNRPKLQIVILLPRQPEDFIEEIGLGTTQARYLRSLVQIANQTGHALGIYNTRATDRLTFIHAKLLIVDDRFLTVGSANFSNRSMGFDSELNLAWEARAYRHRPLAATIQAARVDLLAEHTGVVDRQRLAESAGLVAFLDNLTGQRLCRHQVQSSSLSEIVTDYTPHDVLIDPEHSLLPVDENGLFAKGITALRRALFGR
jgi:phosphatidylserine/phosphatidylglycerophosphate/cardiolipin synthase-like enzyme